MDGILNINKALGITSHDVVARVRKILKQRRVGHTGTLDPLASGVLPICVGQGTRVAEYLSESGKAYQAEITFGIVTDTYDTEGTILETHDASHLTRTDIEQALPQFLGPQLQFPPRYSAIKINGQPAYKRARAGEEIALQARPVEISDLEIISWDAPRLTLAITCSKGTYIRSLAYDLGAKLGCGAHLSALIRTRSGPFTLARSITLEQLAEANEQEIADHYLFPADYALQHYPALHLTDSDMQRVLHGNPFAYQQNAEYSTQSTEQTLGRVYGPDGQFLAIASWNAEQQQWQPKKVLA